jgi:hypothetical protein
VIYLLVIIAFVSYLTGLLTVWTDVPISVYGETTWTNDGSQPMPELNGHSIAEKFYSDGQWYTPSGLFQISEVCLEKECSSSGLDYTLNINAYEGSIRIGDVAYASY